MDRSRTDPMPLGAEGDIVLGLRRRIAALTRENARLRQAAGRLAVSEAVIEASPLPIVACDRDGVVTLWNPAAERLFGWTRDEALGTRLPFVPADRQVEFQELRERALRGESFFSPELDRRKADGSPVVVSASTAPLRRADGTIFGMLSVLADETGRKAGDESLGRLSMAIEQVDEAIVITDARGIIQYVNPSFERVTGFSRMELLGRSPRILKSEMHDQEFYRDIWNAIAAGNVWRGTFINRRKDGTLYRDEAIISPVRDRSGRIAHYIGVSRNAAAPAGTADRPAEAGILTGGVTHDFNNVLTAIAGYCDLLLHRVPEYSELRKDVERICRAGDRAAELTRQLALRSGSPRLHAAAADPSCPDPPPLEAPATEELRPPRPARGTETILLVESEDLVRLPAREILRRCGYTVIDARHPREALLLSEAHRGTIHLVLADVALPRLEGQALADKVRLLRPDTKVLLMSGRSAAGPAMDAMRQGHAACLQKPFTTESLSRKVRETLDGP